MKSIDKDKLLFWYRDLLIIRSWLDDESLITLAKQRLTNLIKEMEAEEE